MRVSARMRELHKPVKTEQLSGCQQN